MLNEQFYKFYNLDFRILMTSHENDLLIPITDSFLTLVRIYSTLR